MMTARSTLRAEKYEVTITMSSELELPIVYRLMGCPHANTFRFQSDEVVTKCSRNPFLCSAGTRNHVPQSHHTSQMHANSRHDRAPRFSSASGRRRGGDCSYRPRDNHSPDQARLQYWSKMTLALCTSSNQALSVNSCNTGNQI